ncbi:MAG TPA: DMT family transporter [Anaerolineales bacterium]|nr:DMT family transporter [Anaerolineales bacterium]
MSTLAIFLLFISASLHASWNFFLKRSREKYIAMGWQVIFGGVFAFFLLLIFGLPPRSMWIFALVSMLLEAIYFILLSIAYTDNDFSLVYPIARGTAPAFIMLWSVMFLQEELSTGGMIGITLIVFGMIIIGATSLIQNRESKLHIKGVFLALAVALMISFYTLVDGAAVQNGSSLSYGLLMFTLVPLLTTPYNIRRYGWKHFASAWRGERNPIILAGMLGVTAYLIALFAYTIAPVSYSGSIRQVSVVIGAFLGWQFLNEQMGGMRVIGAVVIFIGILVIAVFG